MSIGMRILVTNDDGYFADGIKSIASLLAREHEVTIVAPECECSNCGHRVTSHQPLKLRNIEPGIFALDGWPADCVRVALEHLNLPLDFVISGINQGGNLGVDIPMSGTCAAAREAAINGIPSIAISQVKKTGIPVDWQIAAGRVAPLLTELMTRERPEQGFWNINIPPVSPEIELGKPIQCGVDCSPLIVGYVESDAHELVYKGDYHNRPRIPGRDVDRCLAGHLTYSFVPIMF
jgi:5'-nucleotidase